MNTYRISCEWAVCGTMYVEADSIEEAIQKAEDDYPLPTDPEYIDGSFNVCYDITQYFFEEDYPQK